MNYEIRNPKTARIFFWHPDGVWLDVVACGDLGIPEWAQLLKRTGHAICKLKH